ncbi:hypothetical protein HPP92_023453 [Vanilla planifolia]|uniref:Uncharacterized protein n=1 Tax=Vanilla planifolia TaxID=51239 RepID=A0A835PU40_VANPL|nr:hypothetical protein HPP92_023453 [Vanilla planifolia]
MAPHPYAPEGRTQTTVRCRTPSLPFTADGQQHSFTPFRSFPPLPSATPVSYSHQLLRRFVALVLFSYSSFYDS